MQIVLESLFTQELPAFREIERERERVIMKAKCSETKIRRVLNLLLPGMSPRHVRECLVSCVGIQRAGMQCEDIHSQFASALPTLAPLALESESGDRRRRQLHHLNLIR